MKWTLSQVFLPRESQLPQWRLQGFIYLKFIRIGLFLLIFPPRAKKINRLILSHTFNNIFPRVLSGDERRQPGPKYNKWYTICERSVAGLRLSLGVVTDGARNTSLLSFRTMHSHISWTDFHCRVVVGFLTPILRLGSRKGPKARFLYINTNMLRIHEGFWSKWGTS